MRGPVPDTASRVAAGVPGPDGRIGRTIIWSGRRRQWLLAYLGNPAESIIPTGRDYPGTIPPSPPAPYPSHAREQVDPPPAHAPRSPATRRRDD